MNEFRGATISSMSLVEFSRNVSVGGGNQYFTIAQTHIRNSLSPVIRSPLSTLGIGSSALNFERTSIGYLHIVRRFARKNRVHEPRTVDVLDGTPIIPRILAIVQVGEYGDLERPVSPECQFRLARIWVQVDGVTAGVISDGVKAKVW